MPDIYCSVKNCHYWKKGNKCAANEIMVTADKMGDTAPDTYDAPEHAGFKATTADNCMDTCCKTFADKNSNKIDADGVMKL